MSTAVSKMVCPVCSARYAEGAYCAVDGASLVRDSTTDLVGTVLADRYRLKRILGEGGMGKVYEAEHLHLAKKFAIKLLKPEIVGSAEAVVRFRQEAWAASSIGHDNIIEIDDFATLPSGQVYLAMELLEGESLAARMARGAVPVAEATEIAIQIGRGLEAAHAKGILHRDLKPENVFLAQKGGRTRVKILDFGIAKVLSAAEGAAIQTRTGQIFGTPAYMSPEQATGRPPDAGTDIYSLGVIMYELYSGAPPFRGDSLLEILHQHLSKEPAPPSASGRPVPAAIEQLILRMLAKEAAARPRAQEVLAALGGVAAASGVATSGVAPPAIDKAVAEEWEAVAAAVEAAPPAPALPRGAMATPALAVPARAMPAVSGAVEPERAIPTTPIARERSRKAWWAAALVVVAGIGTALLFARGRSNVPNAVPVAGTAGGATVPAAAIPAAGSTGGVATAGSSPAGGSPAAAASPAEPAHARAEHPSEHPAHDKRAAAHAHHPPKAPAARASDTPGAPLPQVVPPRPVESAPPRDQLVARTDAEARIVAPGTRRVALFSGVGARTDWSVPLEANRCYTFVATANGASGIYIYLWGPAGRRIVEQRSRTPTAMMYTCTSFPGQYHLQAKTVGGGGEYRLGVYAK